MTKRKVGNAFYAKPGNSIGYLCRIAFRSVSRALEKRTLPHGVTSGQWRFLRALWVEDGITQRELSHKVGMREPTTVVALKSLEHSGFIRRKRDTKDRRQVHIFLTPAARKLKDELLPYVAEVNAIATRGMREEQVVLLRQLLARISENLAGEDDYPPNDDSR